MGDNVALTKTHGSCEEKFVHYIITICTPSRTFFTYTGTVSMFKLLHKNKQNSAESDDPQNDLTFTPDTLSAELEKSINASSSEGSISPFLKRDD
jgi:hypothetical protein